MDMSGLVRAMMGGGAAEAPETPKWLRGRSVCPVLIGGELFWRCSEMIVRGVPPTGTRYGHDDPHILPATFGPIGEGKQVRPGSPLFGGIVPMVTELGDTLSYARPRVLRYMESLTEPLYFAYPQQDDKPSLIVAFQPGWNDKKIDENGNPERIFRTFAFLAPVTSNIHYFLLPEERERLPIFEGVDWEDDEGNEHSMGTQLYPYDPEG